MPQSSTDIDPFDEEIIIISKSESKREAQKLQEFASQLIHLPKVKRAKLPISDDLKADLLLADKIINNPDALRRHIRFVAKKLVEVDLTPIQLAMDAMANKHQQQTLQLTRLEELRDELIAQGNEAIEALLVKYPQLERQKLKQLIRLTAKELNANKPAKQNANLLNYLKQFIQ